MKFLQLAFILSCFYVHAYDSIHVGITKRWKTFKANKVTEKNISYLKLNQDDEGLLIINSPKKFSLFINDQLMDANKTTIKYKLDSLRSIYAFPIVVTLFSNEGLAGISSEMVMAQKETTQEDIARKVNESSILLMAFILFWILVFLVYSQRSVTLEYFKLSTIFSIRNQDDNIQTQRVTSFNNLFVYIFCSILIAVNLVALDLNPLNITQLTIVNILIAAMVILTLLFLKILITSTTAFFFGITESAPNQFFNFVKHLLVCFSFSSFCLILGFIFNSEKNLLMGIIKTFGLTVLLVYLVASFLRLNNKGESTVFHLFSYLCISEIFPMLLLLKIYYF